MKTKQLYTLLAILAALGLGVFLRHFHKPAELTVEEYAPLDLSFDLEKVQKISIEKTQEGQAALDTKVEMVKEGSDWKLPLMFNARANGQKAADFLKEIRSAKGELRGKGKKIFKDFGIADTGSFHVTLSAASGAPLLELVLGTKTVNGSIFIRKKNSEAVYLTEAGLLSQMGIFGEAASEKPSQNAWAATDFLKVDESKVRSLQIKKYEQGKETDKTNIYFGPDKKGAFQRPGMPFPASEEKIKQFLSSMKTWNAEKVLDPKAKDYGLAKPTWQMKISFEDGTEKLFTAGGRDEKTQAVYLQASGEAVVYQLSKYYFENLDKDDAYFIGDNPLSVDSADKTEKLVVRADKVERVFKPAEKKWDALTNYLKDLKNLRFNRVLPNGQKVSGRYSLELVTKGKAPVVLEVGSPVSSEPKEYAAALHGSNVSLTLPESLFKQVFENLDRLKEPEISPKKT